MSVLRRVSSVVLVGLFLCFSPVLKGQTASGTISGTVTDATGASLPGATIVLKGTTAGAITDAQGKFELRQVPAGSVTVVVSSLSYQGQSQTVMLKGGQTLLLTFALAESANDLEEVTVTGKAQVAEIKEQAFNVNAIDMKPLANVTADLSQVLNRSTGVRIREEGGLGSAISFSLNGFTGRQVKFFLDGIPMDNFASSLSLNNIPVNMVDHVEVYKGVVPVWLGTDALGGAVNIVTTQRKNFLDASYSYGSFNTHRASLNGAFTDTKTGFTVRLNTFYNYSDNNYRVFVPVVVGTTKLPERWVRRFHDNYESETVKAEVGVTGKRYADQLLFGVIASGNDKDIQTGVTMNQVYGAMTQRSRGYIPTVRYKKADFLVRGLDVNVYSAYNISTQRLVDTTRAKYNWLGDADTTDWVIPAERSRSRLRMKDREWLATGNVSYRISERHSLALNYVFTDFSRDTFDPEDPDNIGNQYPQQFSKHVAGLAWKMDLTDKWSTSVFGKYYSMRGEAYELEDVLNSNAYVRVATQFDKPGYGIASAYFIREGLQVKASFEHTYRLPDPTEMFGDGLFNVRNPGLKPEESDNVNLGAVWNVWRTEDHSVTFESNLIYRKLNNLIRKGLSQPVTQSENVGVARTMGVEGEVRYSWKGIINASANVTFQDIVDQADSLSAPVYGGGDRQRNFHKGDRLPNTPYLFGNAFVSAVIRKAWFDDATLSFDWGLNYVHEYYLGWPSLGTSGDKVVIPQQLAQNIGATYSLKNGKYNISVECRNVTDAKLYDNYLLQKPGRAFNVKLRYFIAR